ncbi:MAG: hypothetical protein ACD_76C00044G0007 [uncultured bacterium]|nr:MAG: hypothetical protein ACD_76C00044G0007 [uncultured bacterium]HBD05184.1 hypothetical protein [Candidatus Uhrbacteria bacterium]
MEAKNKSAISTAVFFTVLVIIALFVARVFYFYQKIQKEGIDVARLSFTERQTKSVLTAMAAAPKPDIANLESGRILSGSNDAPVKIVVFSDFECPYSQEAAFTLRAAMYDKGGDIAVIPRHFPLSDIHKNAFQAALASECAREQDAFWPYYDKLFQNQYDLSDDALARYASELNLDENRFSKCLDEQTYKDDVLKDYEDGLNAGVFGTPSFFFNGVRVDGAIPRDILNGIIDAYANKSK